MSHSGNIEQSVEKLEALGWNVDLMNFKIPQFSMHVNYDSKHLILNCPKAYHTSLLLNHVLDVQSVEEESLTKDQCVVRGTYVYSFIGLEVFEYLNPKDPNHKSFKNLVLTGMPSSMYTGEFMPEDNKVELTENVHINVEGDANIQTK